MSDPQPTYLGDGVYVSQDGFHVVLDLRGQDSTRIALDDAVIAGLMRYIKRCSFIALPDRNIARECDDLLAAKDRRIAELEARLQAHEQG